MVSRLETVGSATESANDIGAGVIDTDVPTKGENAETDREA
jgi:hypothetical protein